MNSLGNFFLSAYSLPFVITGFFIGRIKIKLFGSYVGKKRTSIIFSFLAGIFLLGLIFFKEIIQILFFVFIASIFLSLATTNLKATFEDYISRLRGHNNYLIGLQGSSTSLAYIVGPLVSGFLVSVFSFELSISILGLFLILISLLALFFTPRKIRMPQNELSQIKPS